MLELTPQQIAVLERLITHGFHGVEFPLYESSVGVRKGNCAALLQPVAGDGMRVFGEPCYLVDNNLSVRVHRDGRTWFVFKKKQLEATADLLGELAAFTEELATLLLGTA
jgi:hypothetical protein